MKNLKPLVLVTMLLAAIAVLSARGKVGIGHAQKLDVSQTATERESPARQVSNGTLERLQALSNQLAEASPEDRLVIARAAADGLGLRFVEPDSREGRRLINVAVAKRILQIYASNAPVEEKAAQSRAWAADAGGQFHVESTPGEYQLPQESQPKVFRKLKKKMRLLAPGECVGYCADFTILGSGCIATCQQFICSNEILITFYSETTLICGGRYYEFGPSTEDCPCSLQ